MIYHFHVDGSWVPSVFKPNIGTQLRYYSSPRVNGPIIATLIAHDPRAISLLFIPLFYNLLISFRRFFPFFRFCRLSAPRLWSFALLIYLLFWYYFRVCLLWRQIWQQVSVRKPQTSFWFSFLVLYCPSQNVSSMDWNIRLGWILSNS